MKRLLALGLLAFMMGCGGEEIHVVYGIDGQNGVNGLKGTTGDSAYEVWLSIPGNEGKSVNDFFAFLKGDKGDTGLAGQDGATGDKGDKGDKGDDGAGYAIHFAPLNTPSTTCLNSGYLLFTYLDLNKDGNQNANEPIISTGHICHGAPGQDGTSSSIAITAANNCPHGGIKLTTTNPSNEVEVCHGAPGQDGFNGVDGVNGTDGRDGVDGQPGVTGVAGKSTYEIWLDAGNIGDVNDFFAYLKGDKGDTGANGQNGSDGADGRDGVDGTNGLNAFQVWLSLPGNELKTETDFFAYLKGDKGDTGADGRDGVDGSDGADGANGLSAYEIWLDAGNIGSEAEFFASLKGSQGEPGAQGPPGPVGPSGGVNGVIPVQLCAGDTAAHKEYGFVINGKIYAVFYGDINSNKYSFLTELGAGTWKTTNSSECVFTVTYPGDIPTIDGNAVGTGPVDMSAAIIVTVQSDGTMHDNNNRVKIKVKNNSNLTLNKFKIEVSSPYSITHVYGDSVSYSSGIVTRGNLIPPGHESELTIDLDRRVDINNKPIFSTKAL